MGEEDRTRRPDLLSSHRLFRCVVLHLLWHGSLKHLGSITSGLQMLPDIFRKIPQDSKVDSELLCHCST